MPASPRSSLLLQRRWRLTLLVLALSAVAHGCAAPPASPPPATPSPLPPTATLAFPTFSPTSTFTPEPTSTPPFDARLSQGPLLFQAAFDSSDGWDLRTDATGGASLVQQRLVVAISRPDTARTLVLPAPTATDFYLEASLHADLCSGQDEFGLMFRVDPDENHYRFTLSCDGKARVIRALKDSAAALLPISTFPVAVPGPGVEHQLIVLAAGSTFRVLIDGNEVGQLKDSVLPAGRFGVYVRSAGEGQTTVSFTSLSIRALPALATATPGG